MKCHVEISNIDPKNKNNKLNLVVKKNSSSEKMKKVKTLEEYISDLLNGGAMKRNFSKKR